MSGAGPLPLDRILARVSRSFYLSLRVLPGATRTAVALAYLLARAADTVADTRLVARDRRLGLLAGLAEAIEQEQSGADAGALALALAEVGQTEDALPEERELLARVPDLLDLSRAQPALERRLIRQVLRVLTGGMRWDLERFPGERAEELQALETREELFDYCYQVAGCVGEFWSDLHAARLPSMQRVDLQTWRSEGRRFGRVLQLTNVLRDVRRDLRHGRCYLPSQELARLGLAPRDLLQAAAWERLRPLYVELLDQALEDARAGLSHTVRIRPRERALRLAGILPLLLAVQTLGLVATGNPLAEGARRKVTRRTVYLTLVQSVLAAPSDRLLTRLYNTTVRKAGLATL